MNKQPVYKNIISPNDFEKLANTHAVNCISIYIPTERSGMEVTNKTGQVRLKNAIKKVHTKLVGQGVPNHKAGEYLKQIEQLGEDTGFWNQQSDGLAIFANNSELNYYILPLNFDGFTYVANHFYLRPLIPFFNGDGFFYLLTLDAQNIRLFENSRFNITEIDIEDLVPQRLEDSVGYDYEQKTLQHRTITKNKDQAYHGHGTPKNDKKEEKKHFFRDVSKGLETYLTNKNHPLIIVGTDENQAIFKSVSSYNHISEVNINVNPEDFDIFILHEMAWDIAKDWFNQPMQDKIDAFRSFSATDKTVTQLNDIISAAVDGRIDTLFMQIGADKFGLYDATNRTLIIEEKPSNGHVSLYNLAAVHTWLNKGRVYNMEPKNMPVTDTKINALLRY